MLDPDPIRDDAQTVPAAGHVLAVKGSQASVGLIATDAPDMRATVGTFLAVHCPRSMVIGVITDIAITPPAVREDGYFATAQIDLMGEIYQHGDTFRFRRGVTDYPAIGDPSTVITGSDLQVIYQVAGSGAIGIGHLHQAPSVGASVDIDDMLSKHFAVLGTTGVGKSSGVALLLGEVLRVRPDLRIFLLDVHNEYSRCFADRAQVLAPRNLRLPFWLFNFEETADVVFGGRAGPDEEMEILAEVIPAAKAAYLQYRPGAERLAVRRDPRAAGFTADTPVPYRLADLMSLIDERMGKLENRSTRMSYHKLISRIETVYNDPRYAFMFDNANVGGDTFAEVIGQLFRLPSNGQPMTIMQLAGFPAEVVDSVVSALCRMAFEFGLWSDGSFPLLFVCEEAHRYASADRAIGFGPTRKALSRIAKEGRKYGVFLGLVTQRPAELDPTIISQCSTLFAMRMTNDHDQALLRSAVSDAAANLLAFVPSLGTREVLAFGEGVPLPTRLTFAELPADKIPRSEAVADGRRIDASAGVDHGFIGAIIERWRGATMSTGSKSDEAGVRMDEAATDNGLDPDRFKILKKPLASPAAAPAAPPRTLASPSGWPAT